MTELVYLYAVVLGQPSAVINGIGGQPVRWIAEEHLVAAVSDVRATEFDEEPLNAGLSDMAWLAPRAVAHQEVNQQLHELTEAIIPLAFGTVFRDDARVRAVLREQAASLSQRLDRVRGRSEWVVTVHRAEEPQVLANSPALHALRAEMDAAAPGRAHLMKRRYAELERDELRRLEADAVEDVVHRLRDRADDVFVEPLPEDVVDRPLVRASALVQRAAEPRFLDLIDSLQTGDLRVLLTGPWPPYRFGGLEHVAATR